MRDRFLALWRTGAQALFALVLAMLVRHGINIPTSYSGVAEAALIGAGAGVWAAGTHWLQSQTGDDWFGRACRFVGRLLVLGAPGGTPTYPVTASGR